MAKAERSSPPASPAGARLADVFAALRPVYAAYAGRCVVLHDEPGKYYLATHEVRPKDGYRTWLGGVEIKKKFVSAHLMPVYAHPDLLDGVPEPLRARMQGKSCFNFSSIDAAVLRAFAALVKRGVDRFAKDGRL